MDVVAIILTIIVMIIGLVGAILPAIPGNILIGLGVIGYAWYDQFERISVTATVILIVISIIAVTADIWLPLLGAKSGGASTLSIILGIVGAIAGLILGASFLGIGSLLGGLLGYFIGIFVAEFIRLGDAGQALKAGLSGMISWGLTQVFQFIVGLVVFIAFLFIIF